MAEDGVIPDRYPLVPLIGGGYKARTRKNVQDSDGTAIIFNEALTGGTKLTRDLCVREKKPFVLLDGAQISVEKAATAVLRFVVDNEIAVLNVAGPRASGWAERHGFALAVMGELIGVLGN
jgi:ribosomal protein L14